MEDYKNIDRFFLENLKDFEVSPSPKVWSGIESKLKKKKRRVAPIWWFYGAAAVAIIITFIIFNSSDNTLEEPIFTPNEIITTSPENTKKETDSSSVKNPIPKINTEKIEVAKTSSDKKIDSEKTRTKKALQHKKEMKAPEKENLLAIKQKQVDPEKTVVKKNTTTISTDSIQSKEEKKKSTLKPKKDLLTSLNTDSLTLKKSQKKWSVTPVFAFLNSGSSGDSPVSSNLSGSEISGNSSLSYGVKLNYQFNSKLTFQTGIHLQKIRFSTKNIGIATSAVNTNQFNNLESNSENIVLFSTGGDAPATDALNLVASVVSSDGILNQSIDYIEIPFEVSYLLSEGEKLQTSLIGGFSTLFLSSNQVEYRSETFSQSLGEASNLNTFNFSGNFGLGFDYMFSKKLKFNFNPMIKVHLNTFSQNSNGFRPYFFGVYSGLMFSF